MTAVGAELRRLVEAGELALPAPGAGRTAQRHRVLFELGQRDLALARLAEAHADAIAILAEAGRRPAPGAIYGVWAAADPAAVLHLTARSTLHGAKAFCTGAGIVDRALVTAASDAGGRLVDVDVRPRADVRVELGAWVSPAFAATRTGRVEFDDVPVTGHVLDPPEWYVTRPGFWHGACGPAACWAGGAAGLVDWMIDDTTDRSPEPHLDAHLGAVQALRWRMTALLRVAGDEIDAAPDDAAGAMRRALMLRHDIERASTEILDRMGRAVGPRPLAFDAAVIRRRSEVELYIRQCHAERDLAALGAAVRAEHRGRTR